MRGPFDFIGLRDFRVTLFDGLNPVRFSSLRARVKLPPQYADRKKRLPDRTEPQQQRQQR